MAFNRSRMEAANRKLFATFPDMVKLVVLSNIVNAAYDPTLQAVTNTYKTLAVQGMITQYSDKEVDGKNISEDDRKITFLVSDLKGFEIDTETSITLKDAVYNVIRSKVKALDTLVTVQMRKS